MWCTRWMTCCILERGTISKGISMALFPVGGATKLPVCGPQWWRSSTYLCQTSPSWTEASLDRWPQWFARKPAVNVVGNNVAAIGFPGLVCGAAKQCCDALPLIPLQHGKSGRTAPLVWTGFSWRCTAVVYSDKTFCHLNGRRLFPEHPVFQGAHLWALSTKSGERGNLDLLLGWTPLPCQLRHGQRHWPVIGAERTGLCWHGWMPIPSSCCLGLASCVGMPPGTFVAIAWMPCAWTVWRMRWHKVVRCLDRSFAARRWQPVKEFEAQPHLCGHPRVDVKLPNPSCNSSRLCEKVGALLMVGALALQQQQMVSCGNDDRKPPLPVASGPSSSSQSPPPSQVGPARWAAVTALETAARERVLAWRLEKGLEDDADFAYRWASHEEAIAGAGHAVAHEWLRIRAGQVVTLLPTVAQVMDDLPKPSPSMAPAILRETRGKPKAMASGRKRSGVRLRANPSDAPEAITARVEALTGVMMRLGALAPSGSMTASLQAEWHQACTRLCQRLITNAEKSTVLNALTTAEELRQFMRLRDRGCAPEKVDLDAFLHSPSTKAPVRALASLKWLNNNGQLGWSIQDLIPPIERRSLRRPLKECTRPRTRSGPRCLVAG